ncbi:hypothetical protein UFOVP28_13 [uncultured Caudovirales phage]|uniref:Uncharacterized protein n=1 Tax=uncultured Caudovirales phage TaxID=2100421 RepID=A0A6J5KMX7_9CAUD|nr:hypothetical protein UFOVP28_13 [uncultured Caudovirales phage]
MGFISKCQLVWAGWGFSCALNAIGANKMFEASVLGLLAVLNLLLAHKSPHL